MKRGMQRLRDGEVDGEKVEVQHSRKKPTSSFLSRTSSRVAAGFQQPDNARLDEIGVRTPHRPPAIG